MTKNSDKETLVVGESKPFKVIYNFRHVQATDTRNAYLGLITDVSISVQSKLGFPDFSLYSGLLHTVRAMAIKSWLAPSTRILVNGVEIYINDLGGIITITDR
jgi:hypothetical protein